jgi:hypothetical protein
MGNIRMIDDKDLEGKEMLRVAIRCAIVVLICFIGYLLVGCASQYKKQSVHIPMTIHLWDTEKVNQACNFRPACSTKILDTYHIVIDRNGMVEQLFWHEVEHILNPEIKEYEAYR